MEDIFFRELNPKDAEISWKWRNDPEIWKYTRRVHREHITKEIEQAWIEQELKKDNVKRFAICIGNQQKYVGNVHLCIEKSGEAECHIFIGDKEQWGKGITSKALSWCVDYARKELRLKKLIGKIHKNNEASIRASTKAGFRKTGIISGDFVHLEVLLND